MRLDLPSHVEVPVTASLAEAERIFIEAKLAACRWNKARTAQELGIALKTLYNKLHLYGLNASIRKNRRPKSFGIPAMPSEQM